MKQQHKQQITSKKTVLPENSFFQGTTKVEEFYAHFSKLHNSRANTEQSSHINVSDYQATFQKYKESGSLIDRIIDTFDNGKITDLFSDNCQFVPTTVYMQLPIKTKANIQHINFFYAGETQENDIQFDQLFSLHNFAVALSQVKQTPAPLEEVELQPSIHREQMKNNARSQTVATINAVESKVDLLLNEINFQKKRRDDCSFYVQAMEIKLNEFIDYIIGDDDRFIGLSLKDKALQILKQLHTFKGKKLEGWLVLVLLEIFFEEFKDLQVFKVGRLRQQRKKQEQKHEVQSQADAKSMKSINSSGKKERYSEPNSRRNTVQEQEWIK